MSWLSDKVKALRIDSDIHSVEFVRSVAEYVGEAAIKEAAQRCFSYAERLNEQASIARRCGFEVLRMLGRK